MFYILYRLIYFIITLSSQIWQESRIDITCLGREHWHSPLGMKYQSVAKRESPIETRSTLSATVLLRLGTDLNKDLNQYPKVVYDRKCNGRFISLV